jgi:hypothetical protein
MKIDLPGGHRLELFPPAIKKANYLPPTARLVKSKNFASGGEKSFSNFNKKNALTTKNNSAASG